MSFSKSFSRDSGKRAKNDFYPTHPVATYALSKMVSLPILIWEPAAGKGHMALELRRLGHSVVCTDLYSYSDPLVPDVKTGIDFLVTERCDYDGIVTNPPYGGGLAKAFSEKSLSLSSFVALLCRLQFIESRTRLSMFLAHPPTWIFPFSDRIGCIEEDWDERSGVLGGIVPYAWFVWDYRNGRSEGTRMRWIDTKAMITKRNAELIRAA